jgi:tripartite-type tricarboxylate transporter receptor subunit TctC
MSRVFSALAAAALCAFAPASQAQDDYPSRPIRIIMPFAAGGGPDVQLRQLAPKLAQAIGGNVVVENRVGAAGIIAAEVAAQSAPDGYTLLNGSISQVVQKILQPDARFDPQKFVMISLINTSPAVLAVSRDSPAHTVQELAALIRARPGEFNYSSGGVGTAAHLAGASFCVFNGLSAVHVPLRGSVEILQSLVGGLTQFAFPIAGTGVPNVKSGRLRALAVTSRNRLPVLPDVPTLFEVYKKEALVQDSWDALWAPAGTPPAIIRKLFAATAKAVQDPMIKSQLEAQGAVSVASKSPEDLAAYVRAETAKWTEIVRISKAKAE